MHSLYKLSSMRPPGRNNGARRATACQLLRSHEQVSSTSLFPHPHHQHQKRHSSFQISSALCCLGPQPSSTTSSQPEALQCASDTLRQRATNAVSTDHFPRRWSSRGQITQKESFHIPRSGYCDRGLEKRKAWAMQRERRRVESVGSWKWMLAK